MNRILNFLVLQVPRYLVQNWKLLARWNFLKKRSQQNQITNSQLLKDALKCTREFQAKAYLNI